MTTRTITLEVPEDSGHSAAYLAGLATVIASLSGLWTSSAPWLGSAMLQLAAIVADEALKADHRDPAETVKP